MSTKTELYFDSKGFCLVLISQPLIFYYIYSALIHLKAADDLCLQDKSW